VLGVVSTHFARPQEPSELELTTLKDYCAFASDYLEKLIPDAKTRAHLQIFEGTRGLSVR
jgi:hypothetical protein